MSFDPESQVGGAERYVSCLARALALHPSVDHVRLVTFGPEERAFDHGPKLAEHVLRATFPGGNRSNPIPSPRLLRFTDWDVVYTHQFHSWLTTAIIAWAKTRRKPVVLTDHNGGGATYNRCLRLDRGVDLFLATSGISVADAAIAARKTAVIYGGVNEAFFTPGAQEREGVLFVGRAHPIKGIDRLLDAVSNVRKSGHVTLALAVDAGSRGYADALEAQWAALAPRSSLRVSFRYNLTPEELKHAYRSHRLTVLPSIGGVGRECLGLTPLESLASGTPAAVSRHTGIAELARAFPTPVFQVVDDWCSAITTALAEPVPEGGREWLLAHGTWSGVAARVVHEIIAIEHPSQRPRGRRI